MNGLKQEIEQLKKEKNALILAHYYQTLDIQEVSDVVGDSFELARRAKETQAQTIVLCGVRFMAESAKILNPGKTVLLPAPDAGCPMADMIGPQEVQALKESYPDAAVVCYVNSTAAVKAVSDICCTSSSAERVVRSLPNKQILFIPDRNLGAYVASKVPEKEMILYEGFCPTHNRVSEKDILAAKRLHPEAVVLAHPECRPEVLRYADYIGSTSGILAAVETFQANEFIIGTEITIADKLTQMYPDQRFYPMSNAFVCPNMKKTRLLDVVNSLRNLEYEIVLDDREIEAASVSLTRMVSV
jgi:quinolinate synthase